MVAAQENDAHKINKSPNILSSKSICVFGLQPVTIPTPINPQNRPINIFFDIGCPSNGAAKITVKIGLNVIISEASPAAV